MNKSRAGTKTVVKDITAVVTASVSATVTAGASTAGTMNSAAAQSEFKLGVPPILDVFEFARREQLMVGAFDTEELGRLLDGLPLQPEVALSVLTGPPETPGIVRYIVQGQRSSVGKPQINLHVQTQLVLECQRCLGPLVFPIDRQVIFDLVRNESDLIDDPSRVDQDDLDVPEKVVGSREFDLLDLIEDELILEVPYVPRHERCPGETVAAADAESDPEEGGRPSPFAVLGQLNTKSK